MTFEEILSRLKKESGSIAWRDGWNGKGMWVSVQRPDEFSKMRKPYLYIHTVEKELVPWVASHSDMLTDDWYMGPQNEDISNS